MQGRFAYLLTFDPSEAALARLELFAMCGAPLPQPLAPEPAASQRIVFWNIACDISSAAYPFLLIEVLCQAESFPALVQSVAAMGLRADPFAVQVIRVPPRPRMNTVEAAAALGRLIHGTVNLEKPAVRFVCLAQQDRYIFGRELSRSRRDWHDAAQRPANFSNALPPRFARALVNIVAAPGDRLLDPCCGVGTVLIEAARVGARPEGVEISPANAANARRNLQAFGLAHVPVHRADARDWSGHYDAAIIDLPYGVTSVAHESLHRSIVSNIARLAPRLAVITARDDSHLWRQIGLRVIAVAPVPASRLVRHVHLLYSPRNREG